MGIVERLARHAEGVEAFVGGERAVVAPDAAGLALEQRQAATGGFGQR